MRKIDLDALAIFRAVVAEGGVVRAAEKLNRVPSNITTRVRQLEDLLDVKLFRREGRGLRLTGEGEMLLAYAHRLLQLSDEAVGAVSSGAPQGVLRIGSLESAVGNRLAPVLSRFHVAQPQILLELSTAPTDRLIERLLRYEIEAAFISEPFHADAESRVVFVEELVLITARDCPPIRHAADVRDMSMIAFETGCSYRRRLQEWLAQAHVSPRRVLEFSSYHGIIACVAAGTGFALIPAALPETLNLAETLRIHRLPENIAQNRTHLIWRGEMSPALQALCDYLPAAE